MGLMESNRNKIIAGALAAAAMFAPSPSRAEDNPFLKGLRDAGNAIADTSRQIGNGVKEGVIANLPISSANAKTVDSVPAAEPGKPVAYVTLAKNQYLTYFPKIEAGYLSNGRPLSDISETGRAGIPPMGITPDGHVFPNLQSKLVTNGITPVYVQPVAGAGAAGQSRGPNAEGATWDGQGRMVLNGGSNVMQDGSVNCKLTADGRPVRTQEEIMRAEKCFGQEKKRIAAKLRAEDAAAARPATAAAAKTGLTGKLAANQ